MTNRAPRWTRIFARKESGRRWVKALAVMDLALVLAAARAPILYVIPVQVAMVQTGQLL